MQRLEYIEEGCNHILELFGVVNINSLFLSFLMNQQEAHKPALDSEDKISPTCTDQYVFYEDVYQTLNLVSTLEFSLLTKNSSFIIQCILPHRFGTSSCQ